MYGGYAGSRRHAASKAARRNARRTAMVLQSVLARQRFQGSDTVPGALDDVLPRHQRILTSVAV